MADPRYVHYESVQSSPDDDEDRMLKMYCASDYDALAARLAEAERLLQWVDDQGRMDAHDVFDFREMHAKYRAKATNSADARENAGE